MLLSLSESARAVRVRDISPVELVQQALDRAERWQLATNAFSQIRAAEALEEAAARADELVRGAEPGPLHGVPVAIKDLFHVKGWETSGCSLGYRGQIAREDADLVRLLREAGAVVIAKTNQHELAAGGTNAISALGPTRNPWDTGRISGGSSGGSGVAVAARVVPLALGTDTGGSIRIPASFCGLTGLKPTNGAVSLRGAMVLSPTLDTAGPMAGSVEDAALAFSVLGGGGDRFLREATGPIEGVKVAVVGGYFGMRVHPEVREAVDAAGAELGAHGAEVVHLPSPDIADAPEVWMRVVMPEFAVAHGHLLRRPETVYPSTRESLVWGSERTAVDYLKAKERAVAIGDAFRSMLDSVDVLLLPATPFPAPAVGQDRVEVGEGVQLDVRQGAVSLFTRPVNLAGLPALSFPVGFSGEGMPLGAQLVGRSAEEALLLRVGRVFQKATEHHASAPAPRAERVSERRAPA